MSDELRHAIAPWCAAIGMGGLGVAFIAAVWMYTSRDKDKDQPGRDQ